MSKPALLLFSGTTASSKEAFHQAMADGGVAVEGLQQGVSPAEALKWLQAREGDASCAVVVEDGSGAMAISVAMACSAVPVIVVLQGEANFASLQALLGGTTALISASREPVQVAKTVALLARLVSSGQPHSAAPERVLPHQVKPVPQVDTVDAQDLAVLRDLELRMAQPIKSSLAKQPMQVEQQPLDFSLPLREALSNARSIAAAAGADAATPAHFAAGIAALADPVYREAMAAANLVGAEDSPPGKALVDVAELPPPSEELFQAMQRAKVIARQQKAECLAVRHVAEVALLNPDTAAPALAMLPSEEPWEKSFFKPSSLDQAGFVEFDSEEFQNIEARVAPMLSKVEKSRPIRKRRTATLQPQLQAQILPVVSPPDDLRVEHASKGFPDVDLVESAADLLLEGHIIAIPADAGYIAVVDATNSMAVQRLRDISTETPLQILIHSTSQLKVLVREPLEVHEDFLDTVWPGQVAIVFGAASPLIRQLGNGGEALLRIPSDDLTLAVLSMLSRPVATIQLAAAADLTDMLSGVAALLVQSENVEPTVQPTVIKLHGVKRSLISEGAVAGTSLKSWLTEQQGER